MPRVLYVDDDPDIREIASFALGLDPGLEVRASPDGLDALEIARQWCPALILLDVRMPGLEGPAVLRKLRKGVGTAKIPVIFITAGVQAGETANLLALGANGVIPKPFDPMTLAATVRGFLP